MLSDEDKYYLKQNATLIGLFILVNVLLIVILFPEVAEANLLKIVIILGLDLLIFGVMNFLCEL